VEQRLVAIGDSITLGHWDSRGGWVARLRQAGDEKVVDSEREKYSAVYNLGISSNTSADVCERYEEEVSARFPTGSDAEEYVALAVGINDSQLRRGERVFTLEQYRENMEELVRLALERKHRLVIVGLTPVNEDLTNPVPWDETKAFRNELIAEFDEVAAAVARSHDVSFADLFSDPDLRSDDVHLTWDGLHLNARGHERVAQKVGAALVDCGWGPWPPRG
jgi:lysophospholipase L1-like esterase